MRLRYPLRPCTKPQQKSSKKNPYKIPQSSKSPILTVLETSIPFLTCPDARALPWQEVAAKLIFSGIWGSFQRVPRLTRSLLTYFDSMILWCYLSLTSDRSDMSKRWIFVKLFRFHSHLLNPPTNLRKYPNNPRKPPTNQRKPLETALAPAGPPARGRPRPQPGQRPAL